MFFCELCQIIQNSYFAELPRVAASVKDAVLATIRSLIKLYARIYEQNKRRFQNPVNHLKSKMKILMKKLLAIFERSSTI